MSINFNPPSRPVTIGGNTFTVSALPLGVIRRELLPMLSRLKDGDIPDGEAFDGMVKFTHLSLAKADPGITVDCLESSLGMGEFAALFQAVVEVSGMVLPGTNEPLAGL